MDAYQRFQINNIFSYDLRDNMDAYQRFQISNIFSYYLRDALTH